jgi:hydrogenase maturation protease
VKALVVGIGNSLRRDDSVGLRVAEDVTRYLFDDDDVEVTQDVCGGMRLMERMIGYDHAVVIDAAEIGEEPGSVHVLSPGDLPTRNGSSPHDSDLVTALQLGRFLGGELPDTEHIRLVAIQAADTGAFDTRCSERVENAISDATHAVLTVLRDFRRQS